MAIPSSGQSLSFSALRTEFVGGSSAISLGDLYRGGSNILKKAGDNQATNLAASVATSGSLDVSDYYDQAKGFTFTYSTTFLSGSSGTDQNVSTLFGDDYDVNYPKNVVIPSGITLGSNNTAEYGLEVDSGGAGTITITNNGNIIGAGGAGGSAGAAGTGGAGGAGGNGSAGGDAVKAAVACTIINNGSILAGGGGGAAGGGGGLGGALQQQQQTTGQQGPTYYAGGYATQQYIWQGIFQQGFGNPIGAQANWGPGNPDGIVGTTASSHPRYIPGLAGQTSFTFGQYTYYRGGYRGANQFNTFNALYNIYRQFPQSQQTQVAGHAGAAGGAGGLGRGFNNQPGGDSGASGGSGTTGQAGNGGNGGTGGDGGGYGQAGAAGQAGQAGTNSSTNGSAAGSAGSAGAAGNYIEGFSNVTFTNNGTVAGGTE